MVEGKAPAPVSVNEDSIARGTALLFAAKVAGGVFTAALTLFLARKLGPAGYGLLALAMSVVALVELPSDFGVAVALPRFLAENRAQPKLLRELTADGIRLEALGSLLVGGALAVLAGPIADAYNQPGLAELLRILAISLVGQNFLFFFSGVFTAMRRQSATLISSLLESATELTASVALVLLVGGATGAAFGRAAGYAVGALSGAVLAIRMLGVGILPRSIATHGHGRRIVSYALPLWVVDSVFTLFTQIDVLLIGAFLTAGSVAFFDAPMRLTAVLQYPGYAIAGAVSPRLARSAEGQPQVDAFNQAVSVLVALMAAATVFTTVWAATIVHFAFGSGYGKAADVLRALGPYVFFSGGAALVSTALNYVGAARRRVPVAIATVLVNLVLDLILIPRVGVVGAAIGTDVGMAIYVLAQFWFCALLLGTPLRPHVVVLSRCAIAAAAMALTLHASGTEPLSVPVAIGGGLAGCLVYLGVLRLTVLAQHLLRGRRRAGP